MKKVVEAVEAVIIILQEPHAVLVQVIVVVEVVVAAAAAADVVNMIGIAEQEDSEYIFSNLIIFYNID